MRNLGLLLLVVTALFVWKRSCQQPMQETRSERSAESVGASHRGGPVHQLQREPGDMMAREGALPQPGSGVSPKAMLDTVRQGLQNPAQK